LIGLYALFLVAAAAILLTGAWRSPSEEVRIVCQIMFWCTAVGTIAIVVSSLPGFAEGPIVRWLQSHRRIGPMVQPIVGRIAGARRLYNRHYWAIPLSIAMSIVVHSLYSIAIWFIAIGILSEAPSL